MKKRFTEEQIIGLLQEAEADLPVQGLYRGHGFSEASYCLSRSNFGGVNVSDAKRRTALVSENPRLKRLLAETMLENELTREARRRRRLRHRHGAKWCGTSNGTGLHGTFGALGLACTTRHGLCEVCCVPLDGLLARRQQVTNQYRDARAPSWKPGCPIRCPILQLHTDPIIDACTSPENDPVQLELAL